MANFKQQFFLQFASLGLTELIADYRNRYEPKKGDRFNVEGITYEIGPAKITPGRESSSKSAPRSPKMNCQVRQI